MLLQEREIRFLKTLDVYKTNYFHNIKKLVYIFDVFYTILRYRIAKNILIKKKRFNKRLNIF